MNIVVCVKRVPDTTEADVSIDKSGKDIDKRMFVFHLNEWDTYAVEEALLWKEKLGGTVTVVSMGDKETEDILRKCLAMGADEAVRIWDPIFVGSDAFVTAKILAEGIRKLPYDLVLTGTQAEDDGCGQVGVTLARLLGIVHASAITHLEVLGEEVRVQRELEGGLEEVLKVKLPALFTVQTGINEPRYASMTRIRKVAKQAIRTLGASDLNLVAEEVGLSGSDVHLENLFLPLSTERAEILKGSLDEVALQLLHILRDKGGLA